MSQPTKEQEEKFAEVLKLAQKAEQQMKDMGTFLD